MADFPGIPILVAAAVAIGFVIGWVVRGSRVKAEKAAMNAGWRDQLAAQSREHDRIIEQNKGLMRKVSDNQRALQTADARTRELSASLREAFASRDAANVDKQQAESHIAAVRRERDEQGARADEAVSRARDKDDKIFKLGRELESWQDRLPPLIERFRTRDLEAQQLEIELDKANARISELESSRAFAGETQIEPMEESSIATDLDASNEQFDDDSAQSTPARGVNGRDHDADDHAERSGIATYLEQGRVDFNVGNDEQQDGNGTLAADQSIIEVFEGDGTTSEVDELLEAGESPAPDVEIVAAEPVNPDLSDPDDLQQIKGVGPAIEKTLNRLGIYRFNQIADMSEVDIDRVARQLRGFRSRIYREDWIGQARLLELEKTARSS